jgi:hypothetical protein
MLVCRLVEEKIKKKIQQILIGLVIWLGYLSDMTSNGVLLDVTDIAKNK